MKQSDLTSKKMGNNEKRPPVMGGRFLFRSKYKLDVYNFYLWYGVGEELLNTLSKV
jgi:hypothetical protein